MTTNGCGLVMRSFVIIWAYKTPTALQTQNGHDASKNWNGFVKKKVVKNNGKRHTI